ncbi:MAG: hypothetical protein K6G80_02575 [Treponema sp.]|nr:hypothetical protein [Treponema sp.]
MKVLSFGFNRFEINSRRLMFQMATGAQSFDGVECSEAVVNVENQLVIVNAQEPFACVGSTVSKLTEQRCRVLLYGERLVNGLLLHCFKKNEQVSMAVCMEEYEFEPCRKSVASHKRYVSIAATKLLNRKRFSYEKDLEALTEMQESVLFMLLNGESASHIAACEGTTVDTIRHMKRNLIKIIGSSLGDDIPIEAGSWLFS